MAIIKITNEAHMSKTAFKLKLFNRYVCQHIHERKKPKLYVFLAVDRWSLQLQQNIYLPFEQTLFYRCRGFFLKFQKRKTCSSSPTQFIVVGTKLNKFDTNSFNLRFCVEKISFSQSAYTLIDSSILFWSNKPFIQVFFHS